MKNINNGFVKEAVGFSPLVAKKVGGPASILGAIFGLAKPQEGESRLESGFKRGILAGLLLGGGAGALSGTALKGTRAGVETLIRKSKTV